MGRVVDDSHGLGPSCFEIHRELQNQSLFPERSTMGVCLIEWVKSSLDINAIVGSGKFVHHLCFS